MQSLEKILEHGLTAGQIEHGFDPLCNVWMWISKLVSKMYEVCLKNNGTVHATQTTFIAEKKALLSMMSLCLMVSK